QRQAAGAAPLPGRLLPVTNRHHPGTGGRMRDHHRHHRRAAHRGLPAGHHPALLTTYQILRIAITDAIATSGGIDADRGSFTIALHAARDQLTRAAGVIADTIIDLIGTIG